MWRFKKGRGAISPFITALLLLLLLSPRPAEVLPADSSVELEEPEHPLVALTFDDGPSRSTTTKLLDGLAQRGVRATFFLVGEMIPGNEDLVERMEAEGHQIGVHTYDHVWLTSLNAADFQAQVGRTRALLTGILDREGFPLRPPYGGVDDGVKKRAGSAIILWSVDPEDWKYQDAARVAAHVVSQAEDGDIILLHDIYPASVEAALDIVDVLHQRGFLFATVEELAAARHVELTPGQVYREFHP